MASLGFQWRKLREEEVDRMLVTEQCLRDLAAGDKAAPGLGLKKSYKNAPSAVKLDGKS